MKYIFLPLEILRNFERKKNSLFDNFLRDEFSQFYLRTPKRVCLQ